MQYQIVNNNPKVLSILNTPDSSPSLQEIISIAKKEFPNLEFDQLLLSNPDNPYIIYMMEKSLFKTA